MKTRTEHLLEELGDSVTLTEWESDWVEKMLEFYDRTGKLSEKQLDILEDIYRKDSIRT